MSQEIISLAKTSPIGNCVLFGMCGKCNGCYCSHRGLRMLCGSSGVCPRPPPPWKTFSAVLMYCVFLRVVFRV